MAKSEIRPTQSFDDAYSRVLDATTPSNREDHLETPNNAQIIRDLGLEKNVDELDREGLTILADADSSELIDDVERRMLELFERERGRPVDSRLGEYGLIQIMPLMLGEGPHFEKIAMNAKVLALIGHLLGDHFRVSDFHAMLKGRGALKTELHCDSAFIPNPLPLYAQVAIDAPRGSVVVFHGNTYMARFSSARPFRPSTESDLLFLPHVYPASCRLPKCPPARGA